MANKLSVAFIGTGIMGAPIAGHILDAGYPVTVNNRTKSKAAALVERGAALGRYAGRCRGERRRRLYHGGLSLRGRGALPGG